MEAYLFLLGTLLIIVPFMVHRLILSKRKPPYISENDSRHQTVSVFVWSKILRMPWDYREYIFVRRKNGKYRMKYRFYDVICIVIPTFQLSLGTFIIYLFREEFTKHPDAIPALVGFFLWLISLVVFPNYSQVEARICFRKNKDKYLE